MKGCRYISTEEIMYFMDNNMSKKNGYNITHWCAVDDLFLGRSYSSNDGKFSKVPGFADHFCLTDITEGMTNDKMNDIISILT